MPDPTLTTPAAPAPSLAECQVIELRRYTLHPQRRDALIDLFDREFVESQEAQGMRVLGQFRDLDNPDLFVWLRGFATMETRRQALAAFYGGPVWAAHRTAANATMVDSDNVLLLCPAWPGSASALPQHTRLPLGNRAVPAGLIDATAFFLKEPASPTLLAFCRHHMAPALQRGGARQIAWYRTCPSPNTFPQLPVREGEHVLVGLAVFGDEAAYSAFAGSGAWEREVAPELAPWLAKAPEPHRLQPTSRSALHA